MSKQFRLIAIISILLSVYGFGQEARYTLTVSYQNLATEEFKLAYFYGDSFYELCEKESDKNGKLSFTEIDHPGIYRLVFPDGELQEIMITEPGEYILSDTLDVFRDDISLKANPSSEAYAWFELYNKGVRAAIEHAGQEETDPDRAKYAINSIRKRTDSLINLLSVEQKGNLTGDYFQALLPVDMPDLKARYPNISDSALWLKSVSYFRDHFLENINWNNPDLVYTPVVSDKLNKYLSRVTEQSKEGQIAAIESIFERKMHPDMHVYVLKYLFRHYHSNLHKPPKEYAYIYLTEKYILKENSGLFPDEMKKEILKELERLKPMALDSQAPDITLPGKDHQMSLSSLKADAIILLFWDFSCPVCRRVVDDFRRTINKYIYKNIKVYTVFTGEDKDIWDAWEAKKLGKNWTNTYLDANDEILNTYLIEKVPTIFILNEKREIVDKGITVRELEEYLEGLGY